MTVRFEAIKDTPRGAGVVVGDGLGVLLADGEADGEADGDGEVDEDGDVDLDEEGVGDVESVGVAWTIRETPPADGPANRIATADNVAITASEMRARRRAEDVTFRGKVASYE